MRRVTLWPALAVLLGASLGACFDSKRIMFLGEDERADAGGAAAPRATAAAPGLEGAERAATPGPLEAAAAAEAAPPVDAGAPEAAGDAGAGGAAR